MNEKLKSKLVFGITGWTVCVAIFGLAQAQQTANADEAPIRSIAKTLEDGWNAGDSAKFASPFASDADYVIVNGQHIRTRAVTDFGHKQIFGTIYKGSKNGSTVKQIRFLRAEVALVHVQ
ncbi:MAG: SgcJ/EcaC family oxidoreductase [Armatimonadota bacterium]|nr:SgcJ/EcaC family oxidoreductase [Armatimonadota bacterium]